MAGQKVVVNLATGLEDPERVTIAFLVAGAALDQGKQVAMFLTKEAVRLATPRSRGQGRLAEGCPPLPRIFEQFAEKGGELRLPILREPGVSTTATSSPTRIAGATPPGNGSARARNSVQLLKRQPDSGASGCSETRSSKRRVLESAR
jgi:predicted peroxiredoxin